MGYLREADPGSPFPPFFALQELFGFVPDVFRAQTLLPRVIEAETALVTSVLGRKKALSRVQKESVLLALSAAYRNVYWVTAHCQTLRLLGVADKQLDRMVAGNCCSEPAGSDNALLKFALNLGLQGSFITRHDVNSLGSSDEAVLEAIQVAALAGMLCTLAAGLGATPEFEPKLLPATYAQDARAATWPPALAGQAGPFHRVVDLGPEESGPFAFFRETYGIVPNLFRAQSPRPDVVEAEAGLIRAALLAEDALTRLQKERIVLAVSAANGNGYFVALQTELLRTFGEPTEESDQIVTDHRMARLSHADRTLLDFALKLGVHSSGFGGEELEPVRQHGFTDEQILEAVVVTGLTNFLNTLQAGVAAISGLAPRVDCRAAPRESLHLRPPNRRLSEGTPPADPDAALVARIRSGDVDAFEEIIHRHSRRVYRTLIGLLGDPEEARDAMQDTFLKAFEHLGDFMQRSKFSTWLISIAGNTGLQLLRERRKVESLDGGEDDEGFRPRQVRAWTDDPEQAYARAEVRRLVENSVMGLPGKYRVVVVLRDIEQLSTEETAAALNLGISAVKARLLRGRLMLREALSSHFSGSVKGASA